jgi:hypothetical protein
MDAVVGAFVCSALLCSAPAFLTITYITNDYNAEMVLQKSKTHYNEVDHGHSNTATSSVLVKRAGLVISSLVRTGIFFIT